MNEIWRPIHNFERYEVSNFGNVRSLDFDYVNKQGVKQHYKGQNLKLTPTKTHSSKQKNGYLVVNLRKQGKANICLVHRLVAEAFLPNLEQKPTINHIDGNKQNNNIENLEWATYYENNVHAVNNHLKPLSYKNRMIIQCNAKGEIVNKFHSCIEASKITGINRASISHCINGHQKQTKDGSKWYKIEGQTTIES